MLSDRLLTKNDIVCSSCIDKIWCSLLFYWRDSINSEMPAAVKNRSKCWYGCECTTQSTNLVHAQKYDHIGPNLKKK